MSDNDVRDAPVDSGELETYRLGARSWLAEHMPRLPEGTDNWQMTQRDEMAVEARALQRTLFEGGYAGICYPVEYGGQGLTRAHQRAFTRESMGYRMPTTFNVPTLTILAPTILDFGTEEQKLRHIPAILSGEELWVQFLSEPSGGSDLAGLVTTATRDGDVFSLNGSKIWSSGAFRADYSLCLARTDASVPKHQGLTMFILKIHQPGIEVQRIKMINGTAEFCQEFFDDVLVPVADALGGINDGWTVASRLLYHERDAVGGGSQYSSGLSAGNASTGGQRSDLEDLARATGQTGDPVVRQLLAEARVNDRVQQQLMERVAQGIRLGAMPGPAGALTRLYAAVNSERRYDIGLEIAGPGGGAGSAGDPSGATSVAWLSRQSNSLGGGSNEMQRNIISERVLGMPREFAADRDLPFDQVRHNRSPQRSR